jgi:hypothetical protein
MMKHTTETKGLSASERQQELTFALQTYMHSDHSPRQKQILEHYLPDYWSGGLLGAGKRGPVGYVLQGMLRWVLGAK